MKTVFFCLLCALSVPVSLDASSFIILQADGLQKKTVAVYPKEGSDYLDLRELAGACGGKLYWTHPGERIVWVLPELTLAFEDRLAFFTAGETVYQLTAPCLLEGSSFLVPLQLAVDYLPVLIPGRFAYDKLDRRLVDRTGPAGTRSVASEDSKAREVLKIKPKPSTTSDSRQSYRIHTVIIDPGHGGQDPGALTRRISEKEIVLAISRKVVEILKKKSDLKVMLTREGDNFVPLQRRGQMANEKEAGLFVSIHCNANRKKDIRGTSTYFLDAAKTDEERATAMLENASLKYEVENFDPESLDQVNLILQDMAQNEFLRESKELCLFIQNELVKALQVPDKGVRQANLAVLRSAFMPGALVETAFLSNARDESLLRTKKFRDDVAEAIARGILNYIDQYHKKLASGK